MVDFRRVVVIADLHSGHRVGLTPPGWQFAKTNKWGKIQSELWKIYSDSIDKLKPIDILIVNGDCVEGKDKRSGSTELITADRVEQIEIASECINYASAKKIVMTHGTAYHSGYSEDWEDILAKQINADLINDRLFLDIDGIIFDVKHKVAGTTVPYSKGTSISKERLWNLIWNEHNEQPKADLIIRSHIHTFFYCGEDNWLGITTPALQGLGSKYGARQCIQHVDFGLIYFDIYPNKEYTWGWNIVRGKTQSIKAIKL